MAEEEDPDRWNAWLNWRDPFIVHFLMITFTKIPTEMFEEFVDYTWDYISSILMSGTPE